MKILSIEDPSFREYAQVLPGYDLNELLDTLEKVTPLPEATDYCQEDPALMKLAVAKELRDRAYGGKPIEIGWCNGHNTRLNCLEYHRSSEINIGTEDFVALFARRSEMVNGRLDTEKVRAFRIPAGTAVEIYATTLHYAPCSAAPGAGFRVAVILPAGTNGPRPEITAGNPEDECLWACDKWLLAHRDSTEAADGAQIRLDGENIDIAGLL